MLVMFLLKSAGATATTGEVAGIKKARQPIIFGVLRIIKVVDKRSARSESSL